MKTHLCIGPGGHRNSMGFGKSWLARGSPHRHWPCAGPPE